MKRKYGLSAHVCGVYKISNKITNDFYIGSSVDIAGRLSTHFGRDRNKHPDYPMYSDMNEYGLENFTFEVLEFCSKESIIEREQWWYFYLNPTYNQIVPVKNNFKSTEVHTRSTEACRTKKHREKMREKYTTPEYRKLFRDKQSYKFKPVVMLDKETKEWIRKFECFQDAARWLNDNTDFKAKNKASKIKAVCDGERPTAFGYRWKYIECND